MAVGTEELALPLMCVPAHKASPGPAVKRVRISYHLLEDEVLRPCIKEPERKIMFQVGFQSIALAINTEA